MRITLKFIICTIFYIVIFNKNVYSMDDNQNYLHTNCNIHNTESAAKNYQTNMNKLQKVSDVYKQYKSLEQIVSNEFIAYISNNINNYINIFDFICNKDYINSTKSEYNKFSKNINEEMKQKSKEYIEELANSLLKDNLDFIYKYSFRILPVNYLFLASWTILVQYAKYNKMDDSYRMICNLMHKLGKQTNIYIIHMMYFFQPGKYNH